MKDTPVSDSQPQLETTKASTDSSRSWRERLQKALPMMMGLESIRRGLKMEDEAAYRDALAHHELLHGKRGSSGSDRVDDMGHIVLGDMKTEYHLPGTSVPSPKGIGNLTKAVIGVALIGTGAGAGVGVPMLIDVLKEKPSITVPGEIRDWKLGQPIVE